MIRTGIFVVVVGAAAGIASGELIYGTTIQNTLVSWDSAAPATILSGRAITGLAQNEFIMGLDVRPSTGEVYALGSTSRLYRVDTATGAATQVGAGQFTPTLNGAQFGMDFNPTVDLIRISSGANQNLRVSPVTGAVVGTDTAFAYAAGDPGAGTDPDLVHVAYTNSRPGATSTVLYGIDTDRDVLVRIGTPNNGQMTTVGSLGTQINAFGGFDISGATDIAYAAVQAENEALSSLWTIDLNTGAATRVGEIGGGLVITTMTVVPSPATLALSAAGLLVMVSRRKR